jgi:alcohol dehydrogenase class IV
VITFDFATAARIVFGPGSSAQLPEIVSSFGQRTLIVTGKRGAALPGIHGPIFRVTHEPTVDMVRDGANVFRQSGCDSVVAIGGGSAIDAGKAIAAAAANAGHLHDYLEVIGKGRPLDCAPHPFIAVPTTAGTGSEVTRNAVLGSPSHGVKVSLRSPLMLPRVALIDPLLTLDLPPALTASTGLDALTQLIEPFVCSRANALVDNFCREGLAGASRSLARAYDNGHDEQARCDMSYASLLGGLALANAGLGVVHGFAAPIGGMFNAPHGAVCAALLAAGIRINIRALRDRSPESQSLARYAEIARIFTGNPAAQPEDGADWVQSLTERMAIPPLASYGITPDILPQIVEKAARASSMKANPVALTSAELASVIEMSL